MNHYGYFHGPYGISLPTAGWKKRAPFGLKKPAPSASGLIRKTAPDWLFDTEANVSLRMAARRSRTYPYFQGKAEQLYVKSLTINEDLADVQIAMGPTVSLWSAELSEAYEQLTMFEGLVEELNEGKGLEVLNWILEFAPPGGIGHAIASAKTDVEDALEGTRDAVQALGDRIRFVQGYLSDLSRRQELSQLSAWRVGTDLLGMTENVARSFGTTQREMLQGWWSEPGIYDWLESGDTKPWQPVCDLWQHNIDPKSWRTIESERLGWHPGYAGYGTTKVTGTASGDGSAYFMQPKEGQPGYKRYSTAEADIWTLRHLEDGCLASGVCPVAPWTSPITRTKSLIHIQSAGLTLVTPSQLSTLLRSVDSSLNTARRRIKTSRTKLTVLAGLVAAAGTFIKGQIRTILESTGGPAALRAAGMSAGALLGPIGIAVGFVLTESAIAIAIGKLWTKVSEGPGITAGKALIAKDILSAIRPDIRAAFNWWKNNTTSSWRSARKAQLTAVKGRLEDWKSNYDLMEAKTEYVYPSRSAAKWISLGVDASCSARGPDFELPGGWEPPEIDGPGPKTGDGGEVEDIHAWDSGAAEVAFGSLVYDRGRKPKPSLSTRTWLILGGLIGVTYYYMQKEQR